LGSLARMAGLIVAVFWAATMLLEGRFRKPHPFHILVLFFFLWNFISLFWSPDPESTLQRTKTYAQIFLLLIIFWETLQTADDLPMGLQAYIFGAYMLIFSVIKNYLTGTVAVTYEGRYSATGVNAVDLALILMLGLPVAMQLFYSTGSDWKGKLLKFVNLAYIPAAIFSIVLTGSRTSLIAIIPFGFYLVGTKKIPFNRKILVLGALFAVLLALLPFIPSSVTSRLATLGSSIEAGDLGGRVSLWLQSIKVLAEHPWLGIGSGALDLRIGSAAHNTFVSIAAETGFIGFALFSCLLATALFEALSLPNGNSGLWVAIFLTWAIGVLSLSWEFRKLTWLFLNFIVIEGGIARRQDFINKVSFTNLVRFIPISDDQKETV
jgi:O-antigen ligase